MIRGAWRRAREEGTIEEDIIGASYGIKRRTDPTRTTPALHTLSLRHVVSTTDLSYPVYPPAFPSHLPTTHPLPRLFHPATTSSFVQGIRSKSPLSGGEESSKG